MYRMEKKKKKHDLEFSLNRIMGKVNHCIPKKILSWSQGIKLNKNHLFNNHICIAKDNLHRFVDYYFFLLLFIYFFC